MDHNVTVIERAFQLAKSGDYPTVAAIKKRLMTEGYSIGQITGRTLSKQLTALIQAAQADNKGEEVETGTTTGTDSDSPPA
jgi:hypothetical protein